MGVVDIKIDVMRECHWKILNEKVISTTESGPSNSTPREVNLVNYMDQELYWAAAKADEREFMLIVERFCAQRSLEEVVQCVSPLGNTVLHVAAAHDNSSILKSIAKLSACTSFILTKNCNGDTALHLAAMAGHEATVKELVSMQRDCKEDSNDQITRAQNEQGNTAMHMAIISSNKAIAMHLVQVDSEAMFCLNSENKSGLYLAAEAGYEDVIEHTQPIPNALKELCKSLLRKRSC